MFFMTALDVVPGKIEEGFYLIKKMEPPEGIKIHLFLNLFGKPDHMILYEAPDEKVAHAFALKFTSCFTPKTSLCTFMEGYGPQKSG